jgi:hypothetical protein
MFPQLYPSFELILFCHWLGDFLFQGKFIAENKFLPEGVKITHKMRVRSWFAVTVHAIAYTGCYLALTRDVSDLLVIGISHLLIDHYRVAGIVARIKEWNWKEPQPIIPKFVLFILDQGLHIFINCFMLRT